MISENYLDDQQLNEKNYVKTVITFFLSYGMNDLLFFLVVASTLWIE